MWSKNVKVYIPPPESGSPFNWSEATLPALEVIQESLDDQNWFMRLATLWSQESGATTSGTTDVRSDHLVLIKSLC